MASCIHQLGDKFRPTDAAHWLILGTWTFGVIAVAHLLAAVLS